MSSNPLRSTTQSAIPQSIRDLGEKARSSAGFGGYVLTGDSGIRENSAQMAESLWGPFRRQRISRGRQQELLVPANLLVGQPDA